MRIRVADIQKGDEFWSGTTHHWTAETDASDTSPEHTAYKVAVKVRFAADGGIDSRFWTDADHMIEVRR